MRRTIGCLLLIFFCFAGVCDPGIARGQESQSDSSAPDVILRVNVEVVHELQFTGAELAKLPRYTVRVTDHGGTDATFEGAPLVDILRAAGVKLGEQLRGQEMTTYVLVTAADNYQV